MKPYALITGSSKGIGKAIAIELAKRGHPLLLVARTEKLLKELSEQIQLEYRVATDYFACDLTDYQSPEKILDWCQSKNYNINILINNAGMSTGGYFDKQPFSNHQRVIHLNITALVQLTHTFLPLLQQQPPAYILNVASLSSYMAVPTLSVYAASKSMVLAFSRGLSHELNPKKVAVCCVCPGYTQSEMSSNPGMGNMEGDQRKLMSAEKVAKISINGLFKRKREIVPGFKNRVLARVMRWLPKSILERAAMRELGFKSQD